MTLVRYPLTPEELRELLARRVEVARPEVAEALASAHEVAVFGSVARGVDGPDSDLDVISIDGPNRARSRSLDLVCVQAERTSQRWWLGSELAGHVATYGVWLRGTAAWRDSVFVSDWSIRKKSARILNLLSQLYIRREILSPHHTARYVERIVLELARLELLHQRTFLPTTDELRDAMLATDFAVVNEGAERLGRPPALMLEEVLAHHWKSSPRDAVEALFRARWKRRLAEAQAWREAGRPAAARREHGVAGDERVQQ